LRPTSIAAAAAAFVALVVLGSAQFEVQQTEQALITQFGKPVRTIRAPGLHFKLPWVQTAIIFDRRLLDYDFPPEEVILGDQRRLIVDSFVRYRITNPLSYYEAVGASEEGIQGRLTSVAQSALRRVLGNEQLLNVLSSQRGRIMEQIRNETEQQMAQFGITITDLRIRRADLPRENTEAILARMKSERQRVAAQARAEGAEAAARIRADADLQRTVILADARATADKLRGEGEAKAIATYADAYQRDPRFFQTWRTLQAYRDAFSGGKATLVLTPGSDFLHLLEQAPQVGPIGPAGTDGPTGISSPPSAGPTPGAKTP
jgi:membrane protease subunit HflC